MTDTAVYPPAHKPTNEGAAPAFFLPGIYMPITVKATSFKV
jgi:hypothetical protein